MKIRSLLLSCALLIAGNLLADTVNLKDGRTLEGSITSTQGDAITLNSGGIEMTIKKSDIAHITFGSSGSAPATVPTPPPAPSAPSVAPSGQSAASIPAGTSISVSIQQSLSSDGSESGQTFRGVTVGDVRVGDQVVIPSGSPVTGVVLKAEHARRGFRKTPGTLEIALKEVTINGRQVAIQTLPVDETSQRQGGDMARNAAKGAALGAIVGAIGDDDVGDSAAAGAGAGAASGFLRKGQEVHLNTGAVIAFSVQYGVNL